MSRFSRFNGNNRSCFCGKGVSCRNRWRYISTVIFFFLDIVVIQSAVWRIYLQIIYRDFVHKVKIRFLCIFVKRINIVNCYCSICGACINNHIICISSVNVNTVYSDIPCACFCIRLNGIFICSYFDFFALTGIIFFIIDHKIQLISVQRCWQVLGVG